MHVHSAWISPYTSASLTPYISALQMHATMAGTGDNTKFLAALFQGCSKPGQTAANLSCMKEQMRRASLVGASLIIFPELFTTGYHLPEGFSGFRNLSEPRDGPCFQELSAAARELGVAVIYGYPELDRSSGGDVYYNSVQFIDKNGVSLTNYRKTHLWIKGEPEVFTAGSQLPDVVDYDGVKIGLLICYDVEFPETVRSLTLRGAEFIVVSTAVEYPISRVADIVQVRALENQVFVAYVNHCGTESGVEMFGHSLCCGPASTLVMSGSFKEETLLLATIDVEECQRVRAHHSYLKNRRPELYKNVATQ